MQKFWGLLFAAVLVAELALFLVSPYLGWWLPRNVATFGGEVDYLFYLILALTTVFFLLTEVVLVYNMLRFPARPERRSPPTHGSMSLELAWTIVPGALLVWIAFAQVGAWERIKYNARLPKADQVVEISPRQFEWRMRYPSSERLAEIQKTPALAPRFILDGPRPDDLRINNELHAWKGADVRVYLRSQDVIHSFFLPQLRVKQDALPGKITPVWFQASESNARWDDEAKKMVLTAEPWEIACAELCGWGHYKMQGRLYVHPDFDDYSRWLRHALAEQTKYEPE